MHMYVCKSNTPVQRIINKYASHSMEIKIFLISVKCTNTSKLLLIEEVIVIKSIKGRSLLCLSQSESSSCMEPSVYNTSLFLIFWTVLRYLL